MENNDNSLVKQVSKREQVLALYQLGTASMAEIALMTRSRPSYVAQVLRDEGLLEGYFDLYTSSEQPMNIYSKYFARRLGFKDVQTARKSVAYINDLYDQFGRAQDRAGQHHALLAALTMHNRAAWSGKRREAAVFGNWLTERLAELEDIQAQLVTEKTEAR